MCYPGKFYCGRDLYGVGPTDYVDSSLYSCDETGLDARMVERICPLGCDSGSPHLCLIEVRMICLADTQYCGHELRKLPKRHLANNSVYICDSEGINVTESKDCTPGTCSSGKCTCEPGRLYCDRELKEMKWTKVASKGLFQCDTNGETATLVTVNNLCPVCRSNDDHCVCEPDSSTCGSKCRPKTNGSWCECKNDLWYCGHDLFGLGWQDYERETIYKCDRGNNVKIVKQCREGCIPLDATFSVCSGECIEGQKYCASKLARMGYPGKYNDSSLYVCNDRSLPVATAEMSVQCIRDCIPDRKYCGFSLQYRYEIPDANHQYVYKCKNAGTIELDSPCSRCVDNGGNASCVTPWYWYFLGIILPLLFSGLAVVLVRITCRHRRLKKRIQAQRIDKDQLEATKPLRSLGEFGEVWQATYKPHKGIPVDVALKLSIESMEPSRKLACANCFFQEVIALNVLTHENIIKAFGVCTNYKDRFGNTLPALVLEYMNGGSAVCYLRSERRRLSGRDLIQILVDICNAGDHLCKMGIIHRDIAARNVLVHKDLTNGRVKVAKLTDFGLAKDIGKKVSGYKSINPERSTIPFRYTAPEAFAGCFSSKSDVWAFGVLTWELYTILDEEGAYSKTADVGPTPYASISTPKHLYDELCIGLRLKQPPTAPDATYRKMLECWNMKPDSRPTFEDLIRFFNSKRGAGDSQIIAQVTQSIVDVPIAGVGNGEEIEMQCVHDQYARPS